MSAASAAHGRAFAAGSEAPPRTHVALPPLAVTSPLPGCSRPDRWRLPGLDHMTTTIGREHE